MSHDYILHYSLYDFCVILFFDGVNSTHLMSVCLCPQQIRIIDYTFRKTDRLSERVVNRPNSYLLWNKMLQVEDVVCASESVPCDCTSTDVIAVHV